MRRILICALLGVAAVCGTSARKLISWNIQDGMWSDHRPILIEF